MLFRSRLHDAVDSAARGLAESLAQKRIQVLNNVPNDLPPLRVDGERFPKLFDLLLRDELANLPDGASVTFEAALRNERGQPREVDLFVHDNGPGLPPEAILSVLDPLIHRTGAAQGSGLSLMACYFLVYHHGGKVAIEPKTGTGLSLRITLPLEPPAVNPQIESEAFLLRAMTNERLWDRLLAGE